MTESEYDRETIIEAIRGEGRWASADPKILTTSFGNVMVIAQRLGVHRVTVHRYMNKWSSIKAAVNDERELLKDFAESKIAKHIQNNNVAMTIFYAKTQMKDRGYVERINQNVTGEIAVAEMSLEEWKKRQQQQQDQAQNALDDFEDKPFDNAQDG